MLGQIPTESNKTGGNRKRYTYLIIPQERNSQGAEGTALWGILGSGPGGALGRDPPKLNKTGRNRQRSTYLRIPQEGKDLSVGGSVLWGIFEWWTRRRAQPKPTQIK